MITFFDRVSLADVLTVLILWGIVIAYSNIAAERSKHYLLGQSSADSRDAKLQLARVVVALNGTIIAAICAGAMSMHIFARGFLMK